MPSSTSSEQGTRPTSNVTLWSLILLSATDGICRMTGQLEPVTYSKWIPRSCSHNLTYGISRSPYLCHSLICIFFRTYEIDECSLSMPFHVLLVYRSLLPKIAYCTSKLHCLLNNIDCTELCVYHGDLQNISKIVVDNNGDDDNLDWICSCSFNEFFNWIFLMILPGRCLSEFTLLFPFTFFLI
jgi:hypothetical protein